MDASTPEREVVPPAPLFIAFVFSFAGWALLELWLVRIGARFSSHGVVAILGLWLCFLSIRRPRIGLDVFPQNDSHVIHGDRTFRGADAGWALFLFVLGGMLGVFMLQDGTFALGLVATGLAFVPWSRVRFCRAHFCAACTAIWVGIVSIIVLDFRSLSLMFLPLASWILWTCASIALCWRLAQLSRAERIQKSKSRASHSTSLTDKANMPSMAQVLPNENALFTMDGTQPNKK